MAIFKPIHVVESKLGNVSKVAGQLIITTDVGNIYFDASTSNRILIANKYTLPVATSNALGGIKSGAALSVDSSGNVTITANGHTHTVAQLSDLNVSAGEINQLKEVASNVQDQLNSKVNKTQTINGYSLNKDISLTANDVNAVPKTRRINGKELSSDISLTAANVGAIATDQRGAANGVASLVGGKIPENQIPTSFDEVIFGYFSNGKFYKESTLATSITGESGKIYIDLNSNGFYIYKDSVFSEAASNLKLGTTSTTAFRGDWGKVAYDHATNKGSAFNSGLYKIATNSQGHVTAATAVTKSDITGLGIPAQDTTYTAGTGISLSGTTFSNAGVRSVATGTSNGTISVNTNGTTSNVPVYGLKSAAYTESSAYASASHNHDSSYLKLTGGTITGALNVSGIVTGSNEIRSTTPNAFRAITGNYGFIIRNDGNDVHFLLTNSGEQTGTYNGHRPFRIQCSTGHVTIERPLAVNSTLAVAQKSTFTGRTIHNGKITIPSTGGPYLYGFNTENASIVISTQQSEIYHPYLKVITLNSHGFNIGGIKDQVGFYGYNAGRTENGTDWSFTVDARTGAWTSTNSITAPTFNGNATSATKLTTNAGSTTQPVYFDGGIPKPISYTIGTSVPSDAVFKDTHYTTGAKVGASATATANAATSNGSTYLNILDNTTVRDSHLIKGTGATTVTSDANGTITISSTDTKYTLPTASNTTLGGVKVDNSTIGISSGVIKVNNNSHTHTIANITSLQSSLDAIQNSLNTKLNTSLKGAAGGLAELGSDGKVLANQLPSYVDDVIEGYAKTVDNVLKFYTTSTGSTEISGESGKIYVDLNTNKTYRWSGSAFVVISETLALGTTSETAFRGDQGKVAYDHATAKGNAYSSGLYKIATNAQGHVTGAIAVTKTDITNLGIPAQDTNTTYTAGTGISLSGTTFSNAGVRAVVAGASNGTIKVNTNGTETNVAVTGLKSAAYTDSSAYATAGHTHSYLPLSGGTLTNASSSNPILKLSSGNSNPVSIELDRGANAGWKFINESGILKIQNDYTTTKGNYFDVLNLNYNTGNATFKGVVTAPQFNGKATSAGTADSATNATTATQLSSNAGSANQPVYFSGGKPVAITSYSGNSATATKLTSSAGSTNTPIYFKDGVPVAITGTINNNAATATKASSVDYFFKRGGNTTTRETNSSKMQISMCDSSTKNRPDNLDGYCMTFNWDGSGYGNQLYMAHSGMVFHRYCNASTWGNWIKVIDSNNYTSYTVTKTGSGASGTWGINISGNAATATKLQNARTINGTNFDGTAPITTINWGTARKITIGGTEKSVNGSENVAWSLAEIGAVNKAGDTVTGALTINGALETKSTLKAAGATTLNSTLGVAGKITGSNGLEVTGATKILSTTGKNGTLDVDGATALKSTLNVTGIITGSSEIRSTAANAFRAITGNYGFIIRNDGYAVHFLLTNSGTPTGAYNDLRPFFISCSTGNVTIGSSLTINNTLAVTGTSTFTGRTFHDGRISVPSIESSWIHGFNRENASIVISTKQSASSYHPYLKVITFNDHGFNIGGIGDSVGFYGYYSDRKENGTDWQFSVNASNGNWYCNKKIAAAGGFTGDLTGNASSATKLTSSAGSSTQAVYFSDGKPVIASGTLSNSISGNAATASKLTTSAAGATDNPVYFANGVPVATAGTLAKSISGNAATATKLQTVRTINGTNFDGTANITTANWGTARNINIGNSDGTNAGTAISVNGSGNVTLRLPATIKATLTGNASTATQLQTARTIGLSGGAVGTATSFNGTANISIPVTEVKESYLSWGGKNFAASFGPLDAAMIPDLGANRFAFGKPAGVTIEYSTDAGKTWIDYGATDAQKKGLFGAGGADLIIGKNTINGAGDLNKQLRITIKTVHFGIYTVLNKFAIDVSTSRSTGCWCSIDIALESTPTTWVNAANKVTIDGWNGWNIINVSAFTTYGNHASSQYGRIRFTFGCTGTTSDDYLGLKVNRIMAFGGVGWTAPSSMAKRGTIYDYDSDQNVTFPARVTANGVIKSNTRVQIGDLAWVKESDGSYSLKTV